MNPEQQDEHNQELLRASANGDLNAIKSALKRGADINTRIKRGTIELNPLYLALKNKQFKVASYLIKNGADMYAYGGENMIMNQFIIDKQADVIKFLIEKMHYDLDIGDKLSRVPLHIAVRENQLELIRYFLRKKANINAQDSEGNTAVSKATHIENEMATKLLLELGANPNIANIHGNTPIFSAVFKNNKKLLLLLHQYHADMNFLNNQGRNCLWDALKCKHFNLFYGLLCLGADATQQDNQGNTILHKCIYKTDYNTCKFILDCFITFNRSLKIGEKSIDIDQPDSYGHSALQKAIKLKDFKKADLLLEYGADIEWRTPNYHLTALLNAAFTGNLEGVKYCIQKNANISHKDIEECSALMLSVKKGHNDIVQYLIKQGIDINSTDDKGQTALFYSALRNNLEATQILLQAGANPHITDSWGRNIYWPIIRANNADLLKQCIDLGLDKNIQDNHGETILHFAVRKENLSIIPVLLANKVNSETTNNSGETALELAEKIKDQLKTKKSNITTEEYNHRVETLAKIIKHLKVAKYKHQQNNVEQPIITPIVHHPQNSSQTHKLKAHINE